MKAPIQYQHTDRLGQPVRVDTVVAFSYTGGKRVHIGRVTRITAKRVRIRYSFEYTNHVGQLTNWTSDYQADPANIIVLDHIEQQLTLLALKGVL